MLEVVVGSPLMAIQAPFSWWGLCLAILLIVTRHDAVVSRLRGRAAAIIQLGIQVSAALVLAGALGPVWWHFWMYEGWAGPPAWFTSILAAVDNGAAWTTHKEMVSSLCIFFTAFVVTMNIAITKQMTAYRVSR